MISDEQNIIDKMFDKISKLNIPTERTVLVEKYVKPETIISNYEEDQEFQFLFTRFMPIGELCWRNKSGELHSFNGMPSRIVWGENYSSLFEIEWHKNGVPFRKKLGYNKLVVKKKEIYDREAKQYKVVGNTLEYRWLNKYGNLHSFNDMPALIKDTGVFWYVNGENFRNSYNMMTELPCHIANTGEMKFQMHKNDTPVSVKFPLSARYFGRQSILNLNYYEKYVEFPIRELLTL